MHSYTCGSTPRARICRCATVVLNKAFTGSQKIVQDGDGAHLHGVCSTLGRLLGSSVFPPGCPAATLQIYQVHLAHPTHTIIEWYQLWLHLMLKEALHTKTTIKYRVWDAKVPTHLRVSYQLSLPVIQ